MRWFIFILVLLVPTLCYAETVKLLDGRTLKLNSDGTYEFLENVSQITVTASNCKNEGNMEEDKDDFNKVVGYKYFVGFSLQYKITNETEYPLVVRKLGTEFSKDYGMFYTLLKIPTFADPVEPGKSLILKRDSHLFLTKTENKLSQDEINGLFAKHGCSSDNLSGQRIYIDTGHTKFKLPPEAGNLDPLTILKVSSEIEGLDLIVR